MFAEPAKVQGRTLADRLVGIDAPVGGVDWFPAEEDRARARELLAYLKGRRMLAGITSTISAGTIAQSSRKIRRHLQDLIVSGQPFHPALLESMQAMCAACWKFSRVIRDERNPSRSYEITPSFVFSLGQLHAMLGLHITRIACMFDLELDIEFAPLLPLAPED